MLRMSLFLHEPRSQTTIICRLLVAFLGLTIANGCAYVGSTGVGTQLNELANHPNMAPVEDSPEYDTDGNLIAAS